MIGCTLNAKSAVQCSPTVNSAHTLRMREVLLAADVKFDLRSQWIAAAAVESPVVYLGKRVKVT